MTSVSNDHRPRRGVGSDTSDVHYIAAGFNAHIHNSSACPQGSPSAGISEAIGQVCKLSMALEDIAYHREDIRTTFHVPDRL